MTDPIETGREVVESLRPFLAAGGVIHVGGHNWNPSTSAQLRETQAALAASQADLTAMEKRLLERTTEVVELTRERDEAVAKSERYSGYWRACSADRDQITAERDTLRDELAITRAQLATQDTPGTPVPGHHEGEPQQ